MFQKKCHAFYFYDNFVRCRPIWLIFDMIIGQSIYNIPVLSYLLETETLQIVEYQLKCCSVANDAAPDCSMVWSGAACCRQGHQRVTWTAAHLCESWWTTHFEHLLWAANFSFVWFYCFITLLRLCLACCQILACITRYSWTCKARFGGLSDVKVSLQNSSGMCLLKLWNSDGVWLTCCTQ